MSKQAFSSALLDWYDVSARELPWRVSPCERKAGVQPDPYRVWLSEIMLQQTTVPHAAPYFAAFTARWPRVKALAAAPIEEVLSAWAGLGYYARARNMKACADLVAARGGFPDTVEALRALPGIGAYTAGAIAAIAFDRPEVAVDGNVERVFARLNAETRPWPEAKRAIPARVRAVMSEDRPGDFAQALMDLGATVCTPRDPACPVCPVAEFCKGREQGDPARYPIKPPRKAQPVRRGVCFVMMRDGRVWLERRPGKGLLGGMLGLPGSDWSEAEPVDTRPPLPGDWQNRGAIAHVFTHFKLDLTVMSAALSADPALGTALAERGEWLPLAAARKALPTVFRKALDRALIR
jgi:A/G-specific adenine glycosylase